MTKRTTNGHEWTRIVWQLALGVVVLAAPIAMADEPQPVFRAGAAAVDITPKNGVLLDGTIMKLSKNLGDLDNNDTFGLTFLGNEHVVIQSTDGLFASAEEGGGKDLNVNRRQIGAWEIFNLVRLENNEIALKTVGGRYVTAKGGTVKATAKSIGKWERLRLIKKNRPINRFDRNDNS